MAHPLAPTDSVQPINVMEPWLPAPLVVALLAGETGSAAVQDMVLPSSSFDAPPVVANVTLFYAPVPGSFLRCGVVGGFSPLALGKFTGGRPARHRLALVVPANALAPPTTLRGSPAALPSFLAPLAAYTTVEFREAAAARHASFPPTSPPSLPENSTSFPGTSALLCGAVFLLWLPVALRRLCFSFGDECWA